MLHLPFERTQKLGVSLLCFLAVLASRLWKKDAWIINASFFQSREAKTAKKHKSDTPNLWVISEGKCNIYEKIIWLIDASFFQSREAKTTKKHKSDTPNFWHLSESKCNIYNKII